MYRLEDWPDLLSLRVCVLPLNSAKPTDYWIGLQARARGFTRIDPGRLILRYVTIDSTTGVSTPVAPPTEQLPADQSRPVPKWTDAAPKGSYKQPESGPTVACPKAEHKFIYTDSRNSTTCPGFYPDFMDQDVSMHQQYMLESRADGVRSDGVGVEPVPALTIHNTTWMVGSMNTNGATGYEKCSDDYGWGGIKGTYWQLYGYTNDP